MEFHIVQRGRRRRKRGVHMMIAYSDHTLHALKFSIFEICNYNKINNPNIVSRSPVIEKS